MLGDEKIAVAMIDCAIYHDCFVGFGGPSGRMGGALMLGKGAE